MKKIQLIVALSLLTFMASAQTSYIQNVAFNNLTHQKSGNEVLVDAQIITEGFDIRKNDMLVLTPVLYSNTSDDHIELAPVVVLGKTRGKVIERGKRLNNPTPLPSNAATVVVYDKKSPQAIRYSQRVPFLPWMSNARLSVKGVVNGCADCSQGVGDLLLSERVIKEPSQPIYKLTYIVPDAEPVKARSDRHSASFNYRVGRHELLRDFQNNAAELNRVDRVINEVKSNKDLEITEFTVTGYASPEGNFESNRALSDRRANSFADYLSSTHGVARDRFRVSGLGEDWNGLKEAVEKSSLADKNEIIRVINNVSNPDARDAELKKLSGGQTYRSLLDIYYPPLRRTDYTIAYTVRAFSVEEAKGVIKTNPKLLSLNEMFLVAQTYAPASSEFKEVFDIATRLYPDEPIAILNSAAADIEGGNNRAAIDRLNRIESDPRAWNNLGVAYVRLGDTAKAKEYFQRAALRGDEDAKHNLEELGKTMKN